MNEYGLLQSWLNESQSREKKNSITLLQQQSSRQHKTPKPLQQKHLIPQQQSNKNKKLNRTANTSLMLSTGFHQIQSHNYLDRSSTISRRSNSYLVKKWENNKKMSNMHFFQNQNFKTQETQYFQYNLIILSSTSN
jgi:hypothetical protein